MASPITPALRAKINDDMFHQHRLGYWLPKDRRIIVAWTKQLMERIRQAPKDPPQLDPLLVQFQEFIEGHAVLGPLSNDMFTEVPNVAPYNEDPEGNQEVRSFGQMILAFNALLRIGPSWNDIANQIGLIGCPFNAVLDWPMATASGYMFFLWPEVNQYLQKILAEWEGFLKSPASSSVLLPPQGWFGTHGMTALVTKGNQNGLGTKSALTFPELYQCPDPNDGDSKYGFQCWEDFFVRKFNDGIRPLPNPDDETIIVHACESAPLQYPVSPVQLSDNFQGKNQNYSLINMLDQDPLASKFVGGTVYQAFLSCLGYHQWHAPVSGTIVAQRPVAGTYYSQNLYQSFFGHFEDGRTPDPAAPTWSQPYIASVAARGLIFIQADYTDIGLICFMAIGMTDTSGVEFDKPIGYHLTKGEVMGRFHFGGSTYCLIFGPQAKLQWTGIPAPNDPLWPTSLDAPEDNMPDFHVNSELARVVKSK
ncbi:uncharacterized protein K441DRAFT_148548 [Cenococcum geophilum 1.58]|uniref:uncharacterized protein n=1 Tax=Cenococcum geophilum 1.58 TaxID=794803 RepID=UPI00358E2761|nr:hypothetical protein K441DRAFT_148548 [Cenococcum geophilum 1.58]